MLFKDADLCDSSKKSEKLVVERIEDKFKDVRHPVASEKLRYVRSYKLVRMKNLIIKHYFL